MNHIMFKHIGIYTYIHSTITSNAIEEGKRS